MNELQQCVTADKQLVIACHLTDSQLLQKLINFLILIGYVGFLETS